MVSSAWTPAPADNVPATLPVSANPATPVQMLAQNWASTYTLPQTTQDQLAFLTASATWKPSDTWTYQGIAYFRNFTQNHVDGNPTDPQNSFVRKLGTKNPDPNSRLALCRVA
jgi:hypothetical protein